MIEDYVPRQKNGVERLVTFCFIVVCLCGGGGIGKYRGFVEVFLLV